MDCTCGAVHEYPNEEWNLECSECRKYYEETSIDTCPFAIEIHDDDVECECTEAQRYSCAMAV